MKLAIALLFVAALAACGVETAGTAATAASIKKQEVEQGMKTLDQAQQTLESLERTLSGADEARVRAASTLEELERAMKAIRNLVDYIQTHPEAVVLGKPGAKEKQ